MDLVVEKYQHKPKETLEKGEVVVTRLERLTAKKKKKTSSGSFAPRPPNCRREMRTIAANEKEKIYIPNPKQSLYRADMESYLKSLDIFNGLGNIQMKAKDLKIHFSIADKRKGVS